MKQYDYIIGVDPDCEKSGVATLRTSDKSIELKTDDFPKLVQYFSFLKTMSETASVIVLIEAGWLNQSNWHLHPKDSKAVAAAKGNAVGRNHETGRKLVEMAKYFGLNVREVLPLKKCWRGTDGKISHDEISYFIPGFPNRSNQEVRDASLLLWNFAGYPIKVKPISRKVAVI